MDHLGILLKFRFSSLVLSPCISKFPVDANRGRQPLRYLPMTPSLLVSLFLCRSLPLSVDWPNDLFFKEQYGEMMGQMSLLRKGYRKVVVSVLGTLSNGSDESHPSGCELFYCEICMIRDWNLWTTARKKLGLPAATGYLNERGSRSSQNPALR